MISFITNFLASPMVMLGLIALIGLLFLKKSAGDIISGTLKTMMGYLVLSAGTGIIMEPINLLTKLVQTAVGSSESAVLPLYWAVYGKSMELFGTEAALMFVIGMAVNMILARVTKFKYLALTVHLQLFWTAFMACILDAAGFSGTLMVVVGGVISGLYFWFVTGMSARYIKPYTEDHANFVPSVVGLIVAGESARLFQKKKIDTESIKYPKWMEFLKDSTLACVVSVLLMNIAFTLVAGPAVASEMAGATPVGLYLVTMALTFGGGIAVILYGVRMMLAELIPAFSGIAEKILPNVKLGLDYPTAFPYAGTSVMLGFIFSLLGSIVATLVMSLTGFTPVVVPGVQINFFEGALIGVYANAKGGLLNVIFSCFICGFALQFLVAFTFPLTGKIMETNGAYEAIDFNTIGYLFAKLFSLVR